MRFSKFEALGNDFLVVLERELPAHIGRSTLAREICDRKRGAGADGLLIIGPPVNPEAKFSMQVWNADGSEAEISGNGLRCAAAFKLLCAEFPGDSMEIETRAGARTLRLVRRKSELLIFSADMGVPVLKSEEIPVAIFPAREKCIDQLLEGDGLHLRATVTSMGNPHCSVFVEDFAPMDWRGIGAKVERHPLFPRRTNVEFIRVLDRRHIEVRFWERGVGETCSSGTGACAATVASVLNELTDRRVTVLTVEGALGVEWTASGQVLLEGPVRLVFHGEWRPAGGKEGMESHV